MTEFQCTSNECLAQQYSSTLSHHDRLFYVLSATSDLQAQLQQPCNDIQNLRYANVYDDTSTGHRSSIALAALAS
jgi:hypothetical protein